MKKIVSLAVSVFLITAMFVPAFAESECAGNATLCTELPLEYRQFETTQYENVYSKDSSEFIMKIDDNGASEFVPVEKIELDIFDAESSNAFLDRTDIPREVLEDFAEVSYEQRMLGNNEFKAVLFAPVATTSSSGPDVFYHTDSSGRNMMGYKYFYTNQSTGWKDVKRGSGTKNVASAVKDVALCTAGMTNKYISFAESGVNLLQIFYNYFGVNNVTASTSDYLQARLVWNETKQYTYAYDGEWKLGLYTSYVTVKKIGVEEYFYKSGKAPYTSDRTVDVHLYSKHYYDPWDYASAHMYDYVEERITWKTNGITFNF